MRKKIAIQAGGYLVLLALVYGWLGIADRSAWQVLLSGLLGLAIVFGAVWLIASALAAEPLSLRRLPRFLIWIAAAAAVIACCVWLAGYRPRGGVERGVASDAVVSPSREAADDGGTLRRAAVDRGRGWGAGVTPARGEGPPDASVLAEFCPAGVGRVSGCPACSSAGCRNSRASARKRPA